MALVTTVSLALSGRLSSALDLGSTSAEVNIRKAIELASGVALNQADKIFQDRRTLAASTSEDLDLAGVLSDPMNQALTFARIKVLAVIAAAANANNVIIGGAASNAWVGPFGAAAHTIAARPGEPKLIACAADATAYPVTAGTGDQLKIANSGAGTPVTYDIVIIGASA
ncbi:hypothetical protein PV518_25015 [Streptomyces sp. ND04-05B]|uniref:hypothetical protein n=1 Tax=Streptomyces sp. ND04-05B TaxID=3028693 RepID=UPI0029A2F728|nr:hypothetical protein [Streptomyces sp. ND04-05B]MDX3065398.1 hypothetical protein [Streptomyces sp. ND04-05B]